MVGEAIKVSPLLSDVTSYKSLFPGNDGESWVNIFDFTDIVQVSTDRQDVSPGAHVNAYLRPGSIMPM